MLFRAADQVHEPGFLKEIAFHIADHAKAVVLIEERKNNKDERYKSSVRGEPEDERHQVREFAGIALEHLRLLAEIGGLEHQDLRNQAHSAAHQRFQPG